MYPGQAPGYPVGMAIRCFLGHGASGTAASMAPFVDGLRARGVDASAIDLPKRKAEDALPAFHLVVPDEADVAVGGHSFGGRVASLAAAEPDAPYAGLVLFSYPLHPPGSPERTDARIAHWPAIRCPVLLLSGESDPFAKIDLLRAAVPRLAHAELVTYPRLGHTLKPVLDDALDRAAAFLKSASERLTRPRRPPKVGGLGVDKSLVCVHIGSYPVGPPGVVRPYRSSARTHAPSRDRPATRPSFDALTASIR